MDTFYNSLKQMYFQYLSKRRKGISKGDIRAFVGAHTFYYEVKCGQSSDPKARHIEALNSSLRALSQAIDKGAEAFNLELAQTIDMWIELSGSNVREPIAEPLLPSPIPSIHKVNSNGLKMVSLFSGAFGLDLGFLAAGFDLKFATDIDLLSEETANRNLPNAPFLRENFDNVPCNQIIDMSSLGGVKLDILVGGPPCQPFSTAGKRAGFNDPRSSPLKGFVRSINELKPRAFVMEEVPGLESSRLLHVPINERGKRPLRPEEQEGSAFKEVINMLRSTGYKFTYGRLNAADYGAPQVRERLVFIGLREGTPTLPPTTHTAIPGGDLFSISHLPWNTFWEATADLPVDGNERVNFSKNIASYMKLVPPGGHWRQLPKDLIPQAMGGAYKAGGGKMGFYRRLSWDEPSPTVVTSPMQKGTIFGHPELLRPLSIAEYKRIQGFPDDWDLPGTKMDKYKLIGNAVSVHFSYALAKHVKSLLES